jgi:hypothetical protein
MPVKKEAVWIFLQDKTPAGKTCVIMDAKDLINLFLNPEWRTACL